MAETKSRLVYSRVRQLFRTEMPGVGWPRHDLQNDQELLRLRASYLIRAQRELLAEGVISAR